MVLQAREEGRPANQENVEGSLRPLSTGQLASAADISAVMSVFALLCCSPMGFMLQGV